MSTQRIVNNVYAKHINALVKSGLSLHAVARHLDLTLEQLQERVAHAMPLTTGDWSKLARFICFNQVYGGKK